MSQDCSKAFAQAILAAGKREQPIEIRGGGTKAFLGRTPQGQLLDVSAHSGITTYETKELVITARAGTSLSEIESTLNEQGQILGFEPPHFGESATLGGTIACGLSGPRRPFTGSARDFVLGVRLINGKGEELRFGGEVIKNVAGYDLSRLTTGAMGALGLMLDISLRVLPKAECEMTLTQTIPMLEALDQMVTLRRTSNPISGAAYDNGQLHLRLTGAESTVTHYAQKLGWDNLSSDAQFWHQLNEQKLAFFINDQPLWKLSLPATVPMPKLAGKWLIDWAGGLRWLISDEAPETIFSAAESLSGYAHCYRRGDRDNVCYPPLNTILHRFHSQLKRAFDPHQLLNPGRMYSDI